MSKNERKLIDEISSEKHWTILSDVYELLVNSNVLNTQSSLPVVQFKYPEELMV